MENFIKKHEETLRTFFRNLLVLIAVLVFLENFTNLFVFRFIDTNHLIFAIFFSLGFWVFLNLQKAKKDQRKKYDKFFKYTLILALLLIAFISFSPETLDLSREGGLYIIYITLISFFFVFYLNKDKEQKEITKECNIKNKILACFKNEKNIYIVILSLIIILAFLLRIWNLTILDPYTDEYNTLLESIRILEGNAGHYDRAPIVAYFVAFFLRLGDPSSFEGYLYWGRLPGVIFSALTVIPIYLLAKKINKPIALISAFLWAISPWAIGVSKTIREYAYYPLIVLFTAYIFLHLTDCIINYTKEKLLKIILISSYIAFFIYYSLKIDDDSTLRVGILVIIAIAIYKIFWYLAQRGVFSAKNKTIIIISTISLILISIPTLIYLAENTFYISKDFLKTDLRWLRHFSETERNPMHWWYSNPIIFLPYLFLLLGTIYSLVKKNAYYFLYFTLFLALMIFYIYLFDRYVRPRYIFYVLPFFTILVATSIFSLFTVRNFFKNNKLKLLYTIAVVLFLISVFSYQNTLYPLTSDSHGTNAVTDENHERTRPVLEFLEDVIDDEQVFITTMIRNAMRLVFDIDSERFYSYRYRDSERFDFVEKVVAENDKGLMILDSNRNGRWVEGYPHEGEFFIGETKVRVIANEGSFQVYEWDRTRE